MSLQIAFTLTLRAPLTGTGGQEITSVELRRPNVGALRGLQLAMLQMQDVNAIAKLLPRITHPALTPDQVEALDPGDFAALANQVSLFFMTAEQLSAVRTMT